LRYTPYLLLSSLLLLAVLLAGCAPDTRPADLTAPTPWPALALEGTEWLLTFVSGEAPVAGTAPTLAFHPNNYLEANSGCNYLGVDYATDGNAFTLAEIHRTAFACAEPAGVAEQDAAFFAAFDQIVAYGATEDVLVFQDGDGATLLEYARKRPPVVDAALVDTDWVLAAINGRPPLEGVRITLSLGLEGFGGLAGCNHYGGMYVAASDSVLMLGEIAVTAMLCLEPEGVMEQEGAYTQALGEAAGYRLNGDTLEILDAAGEVVLAYTRQPSYDTDPAALIGTAWHVTHVDDDPADADATLTLVFYRDDVLGGQAGCRDFVASAQMDGDTLVLPYMAMLDPGCDLSGPALRAESDYLAVLSGRITVQHEGDRLVLHGERGGTLTLEPRLAGADRALEGTTWSLLGMIRHNDAADAPVQLILADMPIPGTSVDLTLADGTASGSAGCNRYTGSYELTGDSVAFQALGSTKMACQDPDGLMAQEGRYLETLQAVTTARVYGDRLWLETADGRALVYAAQ